MFEEAYRSFSMIQAAVYTLDMEPFYGMMEDMNNNLKRLESVMAETYKLKKQAMIEESKQNILKGDKKNESH